jgi:hypothetical protein
MKNHINDLVASPAFKEEERSLTVAEFCALERMSPTTYFKLKKAGLGPQEVRFPGMNFIRITAEARREWHSCIEQSRKDQAADLERKRRSAQASRAGKRSAASANHISKQRQRAGK